MSTQPQMAHLVGVVSTLVHMIQKQDYKIGNKDYMWCLPEGVPVLPNQCAGSTQRYVITQPITV